MSRMEEKGTRMEEKGTDSKIDQIMKKYEEERAKRLREDGQSQYSMLLTHPKFKHFSEDPFIDPNTPTPGQLLENGSHCKFLILGAGFGGLLIAVKLVKAGFNANDIIIADSAGGFGGTWYWNRYPGLMCDIESYIYLPLLEEMGYMPEHKYSYGYEIRKYANMIAKKYNLTDRGAFRVTLKKQIWDEKSKEWIIELTQIKAPGQPEEYIKIRSDFVFSVTGILNYPKMPNLPGIEKFQGHCFHTSRWDYKYTGGSPQDPSLTNLQGKRVGIIGTGATAVQLVPHLAKWAKELYVFQRTPSAVDRRDQCPTNPEWWAKLTSKKGWQRERMDNFNAFINNVPTKPDIDMVCDGWTKAPSYSAIIGGPPVIRTPEEIADRVKILHSLDIARQERIRARVDEIVKDKSTAESLKAWYPTWCKRPCFHDDYLPTFNLPHVKLVDTAGKGIECVTEHGVVAGGIQYNVDVLIFSTGYYLSPEGSPGSRASMSVIGRGGKCMDEKWKEGVSTLHGVVSRGYPNMFFPGLHQIAASANFMFVIDQLSTHIAHILSEALKKGGPNHKVTIEPTIEAEQEWAMQILSQAGAFAAVSGCTPSYFNREGETDKITSMEERMKRARSAPWGGGIASYIEVIEAWRADGDLKGLDVQVYSSDKLSSNTSKSCL